MARERMAAPFQGSSQTLSSAAQPDSQSVSSMQSHDQDVPVAPSPDDDHVTTSESADDGDYRAGQREEESEQDPSRVLPKLSLEVCMEPLDRQVHNQYSLFPCAKL